MTTIAAIPRRSYLRLFALALAGLTLVLVLLLFAVQMEAIVPAPGVIKARAQLELRAGMFGLVAFGGAAPEGKQPEGASPRGQKPQAGDHVRAGQPLLYLRHEAWRFLGEGGSRLPLSLNQDELRALNNQAQVTCPGTHPLWLVVKVHVEEGAAVRAGEPLLLLAPLHPETKQPLEMLAELKVAERYCDELAVGQEVRLASAMFSQRLYGLAQAKIERIAPVAELAANGERSFLVTAAVTQAPFELRLGSTVQAEIVLGRKPVYRLILEH